ncbi:hypothetical protein J6W34_05715 [bacterium]|nr:hypothetical protein [bacterium]
MEVETSKNGLMTVPNQNSYELTSGIVSDDGSRVRKFTNLDITNEKEQDLLLSSMEEVDFKLNDCIGKTINCVAYYVIERELDQLNEETGEQITRKKHALILFDDNNKSYATGSNACYMSFSNIVSIKGLPTRERPLKLDIIESPAEEKGHSYLKVKLHVDKEN